MSAAMVSQVAARIAAEVAALAKQFPQCDQRSVVGMVMTMVARDLDRAIPGAALRMGVAATLAISEPQPQAAPTTEGEFAGTITDLARTWRLRRSKARVRALIDEGMMG